MMSKYKNIKTAVGDSKKEVRRYNDLLILERAGEIAMLKKQVSFELVPRLQLSNGKHERAVTYIADFVYYKNLDSGDSYKIVEDVKSEFTRKLPVYVIKRKLMLFIHGIEILET
jgi:hypothetical protein